MVTTHEMLRVDFYIPARELFEELYGNPSEKCSVHSRVEEIHKISAII